MRHDPSPEPLDLLWFCQLASDAEYIGTAASRRPTLSYISSLVETAAEMGFSSLLTATNFHAEHEAWTASIATLARTQRQGHRTSTGHEPLPISQPSNLPIE